MSKANMLPGKFMTVWAGQLLSAVGSGLTAFALGVYVFQMTGSAASYSFTIFFSFLPCFVLLPFTGVLADRFDRRKLMIIGDTGATTGLIFILAVMLSGKLALWHIYLGVALSSVFTSIQLPAYKAMITDLVMEEHYSIAAAAAVFMIKKQAVSSRTRAELKFWDGIADSLRYLYSKKGISPV